MTRPNTPDLEIGDVVVSKFGNRWRVEEWREDTDGRRRYVLRNRPQETPGAPGTVFSGTLPEWVEKVQRDGLWMWQRPTPKCECPAYAKAKGPYPSGFCPDCGQWYPGISRDKALALGHIAADGTSR